MEINTQLDRLYEGQFGRRLRLAMPFQLGGAVDEIAYAKASPRITFILKEVNSNDPGWSLRQLVQKEASARLAGKSARGYTWDCVGLWTYGLHRRFIPFGDGSVSSKRSAIGVGLSETSFINLRKGLGGSGRSYEKRIREAAGETQDLWMTELSILQSQVAICANTFWILVDVLGLEAVPFTTEGGICYYYAILPLPYGRCLIVDFWHPQSTKFTHKESYELLGRLVGQLEESGVWPGEDAKVQAP